MLKILLALLLGISVSAQAAHDPSQPRTMGEESDTLIYIFTSWDCPHCRNFHRGILPDLQKQFVISKRAQIIFVDMAYTKPTLRAALYMRCLPPDKSKKLADWLYGNQNKWDNDKYEQVLNSRVRALGFSFTDEKKCVENQELVEEIENERDRMAALFKIQGWPTIALRRGNSVRLYSGTDRRTILMQMEHDLNAMIEDEKANSRK